MQRLWTTLILATSLTAAAVSAAAAQNCPPAAQAPTPEQILGAMRKAEDRGFLWRAEKDGRTSYLFGTVHLAKFDWMFPGHAVNQALLASKTVALDRRLLEGRNPLLAERIAQLHASSKGVFAAVGALHMIGPLALPTLLRERGFRVERVEFRR